MKNKINSAWIHTCILSLGLLYSCNSSDLLDKSPETRIGSNEVFSSPKRIEGLVNGIYGGIKSNSMYGGRVLMYWDVRGEEFINTTSNAFTGYESWINGYASGSNDIINLWAAAYTAINRANILMQGLQDNKGVISEEQAKFYIAEAKFARALCYFTLITSFAKPYQADQGASPGVPLRIQAENGPANNDLPRSSVAKVYELILDDLNEAENNLPQNYSSALLNTTRAHKNTAIALKTRVLLTKGDYPGVVAESKKIIPQTAAPFSSMIGVKHELQPNVVDILASQYTTVESIFSMPFTELNMAGGQNALGYIYSSIGDYYMAPEGILGNSQWRNEDKRRGFLRTNATTNRQYLTKFGTAAPFLRYMPVMRYAEIMLNYAEAAAETNNLNLAYELLQAVHKRSDSGYEFPVSLKSNKEGLINAILVERRIELLGEGFRSNDLLRRLLTIPAKSGSGFAAEAVAPTAPNYVWPLSNDELVINKGL